MNHHPPPPPPPPPPLHLLTTTQILKQTTTTTHHHLLTFHLLSTLIFSLRSTVESATLSLTSFIDHDPSIKSILSRLHISASPPPPTSGNHRRRRPFLQLTRVGTLHDGFFSGDDDNPAADQRFFGTRTKPQPNSTLLILDAFDNLPNFISDNGINLPEVIHTNPKFSFKQPSKPPTIYSDTHNKLNHLNKRNKPHIGNDGNGNNNDGNDGVRNQELQHLLHKFEMEHHEMTSLLFLLTVLSASYGFAIFGFVVTYAWVLGVVFVVVVEGLLNGETSVVRVRVRAVWEGGSLGLKRLSGYVVMRWAVRDAVTQLLGVWFFGEVEDQYLFFKFFVRLKLMPFSMVAPWVEGYEREVYGFLLLWFVFDTVVSFVFAVDAWVAMVDARKSVKEVVKEGCHLLGLMLRPAVNLKCLESIVCGSFVRWVLSVWFGKLFALAFQSCMEVYFMVAWLLFYFSVKSKDGQFGQRELEGLLEDVR